MYIFQNYYTFKAAVKDFQAPREDSSPPRGLLKVLTNEKALSSSCCDFQTNRCKPHPVRGIKQLSEPCSYYLQIIIVSQRRMKNCWRYLNFADFFRTKGGGAILACGMLYSKFFLKVDFFKAASPMIAMTLK
jgi:hypothetical protein